VLLVVLLPCLQQLGAQRGLTGLDITRSSDEPLGKVEQMEQLMKGLTKQEMLKVAELAIRGAAGSND
jgi:hypothetical protein